MHDPYDYKIMRCEVHLNGSKNAMYGCNPINFICCGRHNFEAVSRSRKAKRIDNRCLNLDFYEISVWLCDLHITLFLGFLLCAHWGFLHWQCSTPYPGLFQLQRCSLCRLQSHRSGQFLQQTSSSLVVLSDFWGCCCSRVVTFTAIRLQGPGFKPRPGQKFENENLCFRRTPSVVKACHSCRVRLIKTPLYKSCDFCDWG